mgnify:FL=1
MKRVLFFEPNPHHYEVLPGYAKYFIELNYHIDILTNEHINDGNEFCIANFDENKICYYNYNSGEGFIKVKELLDKYIYDFIFISSFDHFVKNERVSVYEEVKKIDNTKYGIIGCYHSMNNLKYNQEIELLEEKRIITLSETTYNGIRFYNISPIYFKSRQLYKYKIGICRFLSVGNSNNVNELIFSFDSVLRKNENAELSFIGGIKKKGFFKSQLKRKIFHPVLSLINFSCFCTCLIKESVLL